MNYINFTPKKLAEFKKLYERTEKGGVFLFEGKEVLKEYAGYLIEYLENQFKKGVSHGAQA